MTQIDVFIMGLFGFEQASYEKWTMKSCYEIRQTSVYRGGLCRQYYGAQPYPVPGKWLMTIELTSKSPRASPMMESPGDCPTASSHNFFISEVKG